MAQTTKSPDIAIGQVVAATYEITSLLGEGGMGQVWAARHLRLPGKTVAIKTLHAAIADGEALARFRREAEIASRLGHPNIVGVHDYNVLDSGTPYLVLEHLRGESLAARIARGALPLAETRDILRQVGAALRAAHRQHVVHRDLKPQNIFLCPREDGPPRAVVLDFGISKIRGSESIKTQTHTLLGTPQYMAPEQATGEHDLVNAQTDVFALGAIAYEMLAGRPAFMGENVPEVVFKVVYKDPPPLSELAPDVPAEVASAVMKALAKKQAERFADVAGFIEAMTGEVLHTGNRRDDAALAATAAAIPAVSESAALAKTAMPPTPAPASPAALAETTAAVNRSGYRKPWPLVAIAVAAAAAISVAVAWVVMSDDESETKAAEVTGVHEPYRARSPTVKSEARVEESLEVVVIEPGTDRASEPEVQGRPSTSLRANGEDRPGAGADAEAEHLSHKNNHKPAAQSRTEGNRKPPKAEPRLSPEIRALITKAEAARRSERFRPAFRLAFKAWQLERSSRSAFIIAYSLCAQRRFSQVAMWYERIRSQRQRRRVRAACSRSGFEL